MARHFHSASANRRQQSNKDGGKPMQFDRITFSWWGGGGGGGRNQRCNSKPIQFTFDSKIESEMD